MAQLELLLRFSKISDEASISGAAEQAEAKVPGLEVLSHTPKVKRLISDVVNFHNQLDREGSSGISSEGMLSPLMLPLLTPF
jgi:hypothetical protein